MADFRKMKARAKKRRAKSLLAQALLAVLAVALVFGNAYCVVKLVHGEAVFSAALCAGRRRRLLRRAAAPRRAQPVSSGSGQSAASGSAASGSGSAAQPADSRTWNTTAKAERTLYSGAHSPGCTHAVCAGKRHCQPGIFRTALFIGDSLTEGFGIYEPLKTLPKVYGFQGISPKTFAENAAAGSRDLEFLLMLCGMQSVPSSRTAICAVGCKHACPCAGRQRLPYLLRPLYGYAGRALHFDGYSCAFKASRW